MKKPVALLAALTCALGLATAAPAIGTPTHRPATRAATHGPRAHHVPSRQQRRTAPTARAARAVPSLNNVRWRACHTFLYPDLEIDSQVKCGSLKVPLDYAKPHGKKITLAVSLLRHTSSAKGYRGVMLSNPGGPGGGGLDLGLELQSAVPHGVGGDFDWVSFDPRGVGASRPALHCIPHYFAATRRDYTPSSPGIVKYWKARAKDYADTCEKKYPRLLQHMTTVDSVRDMESIRKALKVKTINYYGYSYGTYLGEVYSTLHPTRIKRMVLDSNVDPRRVWYQANLDQDKAFQRAITIYFSWVAKFHKIYQLGSSEQAVEQRYNAELSSLAETPVKKLGPAEWADGVENAAYDRSNWQDVARAWHALNAKGHAGPMLQEWRASDGPEDDNEYAVYNAVQCTDTQWPTHWSRWKRDNDAYAAKYPFLTWNNAWYNAPCLYWGAKAHQPVKIDGKKTKSALLIDEKLDAATPYSGSLEVRKLYPHSSLIAEPHGTTHADSLEGDACVDDKIATYLKTGKRPARLSGRRADVSCAPLPAPHPDAGSAIFRPATHVRFAR